MSDQPQTRRDVETAIVLKAIKDQQFRERLLANPKQGVLSTIREMDPDFDVRDDLEVKVFEEPKGAFYLVIPHTPEQQVEISDDDLEKVAGGVFTDKWGDATVILGF